MILGDGRLKIKAAPELWYHIICLDAFSSDAIPVHLLTYEALTIYRRHMKSGGIIAFHVTNRFLDLVPVVARLAEAQHLAAVFVSDDGDESLASRSDWVLLSDSEASLHAPQIANGASVMESRPDWRMWTDDFNNIVQVLK